MDLSQIIIKPIVTEKALSLEPRGVYVFRVHPKANKDKVRAAVEKFFKVKVKNVNTINVKGKLKRTGRRRIKKRLPNWKKAFVKLESGQKIEFFEKKG